MNIMCLYWVGNFRGRDFTMADVERLYRSVSKHIDRDFTFYCLTNSDERFPDYIKPIPLLYAWPGWWSKVELHRPDLPEGRTLYMDLDSHAIRSLTPILDYVGDLVMFRTRIPKGKWNHLKRIGWVCRYQAATMLFDSSTGCMYHVWNNFLKNPEMWMRKFRSEQDIMGEWIPNQPTFPDEWMVKLNTIRNYDKPPKDVIIVTGQPKNGDFRRTNKISWFEELAR